LALNTDQLKLDARMKSKEGERTGQRKAGQFKILPGAQATQRRRVGKIDKGRGCVRGGCPLGKVSTKKNLGKRHGP